MKVGDTVIMQNLSGGNPIPHLWFIVTEPHATTRLCVMVSLTTLKNDQDQTVVLYPAEHSYLTRTSSVYFSGALIVDVRTIEKRLEEGRIRRHECCSPKLLQLLQQGVTASPFTPKKVVTFCKEALTQAEATSITKAT